MYHSIVRRNVEKLFDALGRGDVDYAVAGMADRFEHIFPGDHSLGGTRHTPAGIRLWLKRLLRVLPGLRFKVKHMAVSGWPWNTTVLVEWRDFATLANGAPYVNDGAHAIQIRWGKVVVLHAYLDTQIMIDAMRTMEAAGVAEAGAPKIED
ncbi:nuclear transport factor 2 family protein [Hyphomicrobium sp.]|uniref:nuclear transport factor 2 family protein n=1 Tax=Hyphomicrobium sp. TaxID=82 RepID=UPI001E191E64|nr:nuclear transport factor 2 family protein [Hyphomicrobium sp.]MBY0561014.1 nuclear transport factor 2 family protein [Hyphomicrobium sp.]